MNAIACIDKNRGLGKNGKLLYHNAQDIKFFKGMTIGKTVVMGKKTFLSLPFQKPLKDRTNIVLTTDKNFSCDGILVAHSIDELFELIKDTPIDDVFVIGGAQVYKELLQYCDKLYLTIVDNGKADADTYFPKQLPWHCSCTMLYCDKDISINLFQRRE